MKHIIYTDFDTYSDENIETAKENLFDNNVLNPTDEQIYNKCYELSQFWYEDERTNLKSLDEDNELICIASLGLWDGRTNAYKDNITSLTYSLNYGKDIQEIETFVDDYGNLYQTAVHHDGQNHYLFRYLKNTLSDTQRENFLNKIYYGKITKKDISHYTRKAGLKIANMYGWKVKGVKK